MADLTLIEKLRQIEACNIGDPMPECLSGVPAHFSKIVDGEVQIGFAANDWGTVLAAIAKEAADTIEALDRALSAAPQIKIEGHMYDGTMILSVSSKHARSIP